MEETREFHDWELLHNTETGVSHVHYPIINPFDSSKDFEEIEGVDEGVIRSDYFSFDSRKMYEKTVDETDVENGSVSSDNPSWIEPCSESRNEFKRKNSSEFWSDSSADEPGFHKFGNYDGKEEVGVEDDVHTEVGLEGIGERKERNEKFCSDSSGETSVEQKFGGDRQEEKGMVKEKEDRGQITARMVSADREAVKAEGEKQGMVWWKLPFEILKFFVIKVSPGWSISIAAAVMGIVILRRRLHKMKKKSSSIQLKVTVEDKKVSQLMNRTARLNEAFSVVKRVPMIRPLLPSTGLTPWPVTNLI
ncbi:transmembrane protein [Thalictrum thalictroides]|uniref:Transmembrane protein n=1 Tax=Thalictrum thalictroides TaxID=46969 RepID=A0A7J6XCY0_THATH|nr:transmembrane protein [Thalictrum thalictroides]